MYVKSSITDSDYTLSGSLSVGCERRVARVMLNDFLIANVQVTNICSGELLFHLFVYIIRESDSKVFVASFNF